MLSTSQTMASVMNGRPKEASTSKDPRPNGQVIGSPISDSRPPHTTRLRRSFNLVARLFIWYTLITTLFRCPSSRSELNDNSSRVCKPYLIAREVVTPYLQPYYDKHAAAHVEKVRPYFEQLNRQIYTPSVKLGKQSYERYGAPRVDQVRLYSQEQWAKLIKPQIDAAQSQVQDQYTYNVAPHVTKASAAAAPYYSASKESVVSAYDKHISPAYETVLPYSQRTYVLVRDVTVKQVFPLVQSGWRSSLYFVNRIVWPRVRILYGENVEPQLMRIVERLGSYRDGQKLKSAVAEMESSAALTSSQISSIAASTSSLQASAATTSTSSTHTTTVAAPTLSPEQEAEKARERIEGDLENWQKKFAKAADTGAEDLRERITEITDRQIKQLQGVGEALVIELEESSRSEIATLQTKILTTVKSLSEDSTNQDLENAKDVLSKATRNAGLSVKNKAQGLRTWKSSFATETSSLIFTAANSTLEVIDNIRDLGLQEIGMRWAWMEGVTYNDWSKYNEVRKSFDQWRKQVLNFAQDHPGLERARAGADELESKGMSIAEGAAKELSRLKEVGIWKVYAIDSSNDFSDKIIPPDAAAAGRKIIDKVQAASEQILGTTQGTVESVVSKASDKVASVASEGSTKVYGTEPGKLEKATSSIVEAAAATSEKLSEAIVGTSKPKAESVYSNFEEKAASLASDASETIVGTPEPAYVSVATEISSSAEAAFSAVSGTALHSSTSVTESLQKAAGAASSSVSSAASKASHKVYGGAMAQEVKGQQPILDDALNDDDDDATFSDKIQSLASDASDRLAEITKAVQEALGGAYSTQGSVASASSVAGKQYSQALLAASSVLYGTKQGVTDSATSVVGEKWADAVNAASSVIYGTPTPTHEVVAKAVSSAYSEATARAREHYEHAMSIVSAQVTGKPKPVHEQMFASVSSAYSQALDAAKGHLDEGLDKVRGPKEGSHKSVQSVANQKYSEAVAAASSQLEAAKSAVGATPTPGYEKFMSEASERFSSIVGAASEQRDSVTKTVSEALFGPSQGVLDSVSSIASLKLADSLSKASAQYSSLKAAAGATPTPVYQKYLQDGQRRYYEAIGLAHERYSEFVDSASGAVYGTPKPAYRNILDAAQSSYKLASAEASEKLNSVLKAADSAVNKKSKTGAQDILSSASSQYNSALSVASASLSAATAAASKGIFGTSTGQVESLASDASAAIIGTATPWTESVANQAAENWESLVSKASEQVYGAPTPFSESIFSQAGEYASQATEAAASQYQEIQSIFSELVRGKEPDFTESVMNRLSSAYYTGAYASAAASVSSFASDAYVSASSVVSSVFTPPATLEAILVAAQEQVNAAVDAASVQYYGTSKGTYEKATSAAADAASSASSAASKAVYGTHSENYIASAQSALNDIASSASLAIAEAIYESTATGATATISSAASQAYASASSAISENAAKASSVVDTTTKKVKAAIYGPEEDAVDSAQSRLLAAIETAKQRLADMGGDAAERVKAQIENVASSVSSVAVEATKKGKDEL